VAGLVGVFAVAAFVVVQALRPAPAPVDAGEVRAASASLDEILNAAATLKRDGAFNKAESLLREAISRHIAEQRLYVEYAEVLVATRREREAYEQYEKALAAAEGTHAIHLAAGSVASMIGRLDRAAEHFAAAQQADKTDWRAPLFLAQVQMKLSQNPEAMKNLMLAVNLKPDAAIAWGSLAELELRDNKLPLAVQHVAKARELEPASTVWRVLEARILKRENKPDEALALLAGLDAAQRLEPGVLNTMAECLGMLSRPRDAAKLYAEASQAQPLRGDLAMLAAQWNERAGDKAAALTFAKRAAGAGEEHAADMVARLEKAGNGSKKKR
jgi:tetratricopeptide (TPR) repeat protein